MVVAVIEQTPRAVIALVRRVHGAHQFILGALHFRIVNRRHQRVRRLQAGAEQRPDRAIAGRVLALADAIAEPAHRLAQVTVQQSNRVLRVGDAAVKFIEHVLFEPAFPLALPVGGELAGFLQLHRVENAQPR